MSANDAPITVFYDGSCPLCAWEIKQYATQDEAEELRFVDIANGDGPLPPSLDRDLAMRRLHVMTGDGLKSGAEAFVSIWNVLPRWRLLGRIGRQPLVLGFLEAAYRAFLLVRPAFSRAARRLQQRDGQPS